VIKAFEGTLPGGNIHYPAGEKLFSVPLMAIVLQLQAGEHINIQNIIKYYFS
jgi:hypothetical protein